MKVKLLSILILISLSFNTLAQEKTVTSVWLDSIKVDGDLKDWKDSLHYYFEDQGLKYSISNDAENLYIAIQVPDIAQQQKAIYSGFSITVNPEAKEKPGPTVVFPIPDAAALRSASAKEDYEKTKDILQTGIDMVRAIYIYGFKDIVDGKISLNNTYGIKTAVKIDSANILNYEAAIRIDQLNIDKSLPFALNLRINETTTSRFTDSGNMRRSYGYPYYGRDPYGRGSTSRVVTKTQPGIWNTIKLATKL